MSDESIWRLDDAEQIATEEIIPHCHPNLQGTVRVLFLATDKPRKSQGKEVWAKTTKLTGTAKYLSSGSSESVEDGYDVQVLISGTVWATLTATQKRALIDHELAHIAVDIDEVTDAVTLRYVGHDVEEFESVVARHGLWRPDLAHFALAVQQLPLFPEASV